MAFKNTVEVFIEWGGGGGEDFISSVFALIANNPLSSGKVDIAYFSGKDKKIYESKYVGKRSVHMKANICLCTQFFVSIIASLSSQSSVIDKFK